MNRRILTIVVSGALALPMAAQGVEISASGHINRALVFSGLAGTDDPKHTDGSASPSRFNFAGSEELENGITIGAQLEYGALGSADASDAPNDSPATVPTLRHANFNVSGGFGKLTVGQTGPATNSISYANLDNLAWLSGTEVGCDFCTASGMKSTVFTTFGAGRSQVIRYDSPSLGPVGLAFSADGNGFWDAALRADGQAGGITYLFHGGFSSSPAGAATDASNVFVGKPLPALPDANVGDTWVWDRPGTSRHGTLEGYTVVDADGNITSAYDASGWDGGDKGHWVYTAPGDATPKSEAITLSAAFGIATGTHINLTWGSNDPDGMSRDEFVHFGIGHNFANTSIAATFTDSSIGGGGSSWGIGVGHAMNSIEMFAGYKYLDHDAAAVQDYGFFVLGSRVKFN